MINKLFKSKYFLTTSQFFTLFIFVALIYGAIGITTNDKDFAIILRNTNLANLIVWSYWWPLIIVTAILFGRYWCSICPMELITSFFAKIGLRKKPGKWLKSSWVITLFYALILIIGIHTLAIHRIPRYMAIYMLILFSIAVISGLIWEKRTFCTYICPIGHLLGLYSLLSFKKLRVIDADVCKTCKTKDCISSENYYKFTSRSCTSELYPAKITDNRDCILCGQCFKSCTKDNIAIQKRRLAADLYTNIKLSWPEIVFFIMVSGFVVYEILSEWKVSKEILLELPHWVNNQLHTPTATTGTVKVIILFLFVPGVFYTFFAFAIKLFTKTDWRASFSQLVLAILPVTASMHLLKALLKTTSRIPYWDFVFSDPLGVKTAHLFMDKTISLDKSILLSLSPFISTLAILLPLGALALSLNIIRKRQNENQISKLITAVAVLIYGSLFLVSLTAWRIF